MKKNLTKIMLSAAVLISASVGAQVANYVFTQSSGTYVAISGGTLLATTSTIDDNVFVNPSGTSSSSGSSGLGLSIGFTFTFNGVPYDRIGIDNNGWIAFGQSSLTTAVNLNSSSSHSAISSTSTASLILQQRVAALGINLRGQSGCSLRMETLGSTPNQTCVIQWNNYRNSGASGDTLNFQIRLWETSNVVEVVYDIRVPLGTSYTAQVGLRGTSNSDFNTRLVNNANSWNSSITGSVNTSGATFNAFGLAPAKGYSYKWYPPVPCTSIAANTAISQYSLICPTSGASDITLVNTYTNAGFTYQWYGSTASAIGPYQAIGGATVANIHIDTLLTQTWYQAVITCTNSLNTVTISPVNIQIVATTTNSVPYFEDFEGIIKNNGLPNCSWMASSMGTACFTFINTLFGVGFIPRSGSKYATFISPNTPLFSNYFLSNGIQLEPGVTYSTGVYYIGDGGDGWSSFSLMLGSSQAVSSFSTIATVVPAGSFYKLLSNTFTVATSGIYYLGLKAVNIGVGGSDALTFDDLFITAPCALNPVPVNISAANYTICSGKSTTLTASGANSYNWGWGGGPTGSSIIISPQVNTVYNVSGTNSLTGCQNTTFINIVVNPSPVADIFILDPSVCSGSSVTLYGTGNGQFSWSNGSTAPSIVVSPQVNTTYTLSVVSSTGGCVSSVVQAITVNTPAPVFVQTSTGGSICVGETAQLSGSGNNIVSFKWKSNNIIIQSQVAQVSPLTSTAYTLVGTDVNGCTSTQTAQLLVSPCTGIAENIGNGNLLVYPNPTSGQLIISTGNVQVKNIVVTDVTGRLISTTTSGAETVELNLEGFAKGIYYAKITTNKESNVVKIVKE